MAHRSDSFVHPESHLWDNLAIVLAVDLSAGRPRGQRYPRGRAQQFIQPTLVARTRTVVTIRDGLGDYGRLRSDTLSL
jgi:hypothetical protein